MPDFTGDEIKKRFIYHPPTADKAPRHDAIRAKAHTLAQSMIEAAPPSRELSLAITKLEESVMWCNAAIARNE